MDTSKEYIKMCERAGIRGLWQPKEGDFIYKIDDLSILTHHDCCMGDYCESPEWNIANKTEDIIKDSDLVWLPRQDQLQEIYGKVHYAFIKNFWDYVENGEQLWRGEPVMCRVVGDSLEQQALMFVMKAKFNKIWNGEEWIK